MSSFKSTYAAKRRVAKGWLIVFTLILVVGLVLVGVSYALPRGGFGGRGAGGGGLFGSADLVIVNSSSSQGTGPGSFFGSSSPFSESVTKQVDGVQGVASATPQLTALGNIQGTSALLTGVDPATYSNVSDTPSLSSGQFISQEGAEQIVIGDSLANTLGVTVEATITVTANTTSASRTFTIVGLTPTPSTTNRFGFQRSFAFVSLSDLQNMTGEVGLVNRILVRLQDSSQSSAVSSQIDSSIPGIRVLTPGSFTGFGGAGANPFTAISRPTSTRGILLISGLVIAPLGGLGVVWNYSKMRVAKRREQLQKRKGRNKPAQS